MASKVNIRKGHRAYVTKTVADLEKELRGDEPDELILHSLQSTLVEKMERLKVLDDEILEGLTDEAEILAEIDRASEIRLGMQKGIFAVEKFFKEKEKKPTSNVPVRSDYSVSNAKLPKLAIKPFSGNPLDYQSFWDTFTAAVHSNATLDDILKFTYLKTHLRGPALSAVDGLSLTSENYQSAVAILEQRFGNKQLLINSHVEKMMGIDPVTSSRDIRKIRNVYDTIEVHVRNLTSLEIETNQYGPVLVSVIMAKLPEDIRLFISRSMSATSQEQWDVKKLMDALKAEIESRELCQRMSSSVNSRSSNDGDDLLDDTTQMTSAFHIGNRNQQQVSCTYCKRNHPSAKCNVVTDVQAKKKILRNKGKCFVCLKSGHIAPRCTSGMKCHRCKQRHHISICDSESSSRDDGSAQLPAEEVVPRDGRGASQEGNQVPGQVVRTQTNVAASTRPNTLLQTAQCLLSSKTAQKKIRILLDLCSQRSFINEDLCKQLNLSVIRSERMILEGFQSENAEAKMVTVVKAQLSLLNGNLCGDVELHVVPKICSPISQQTVEVAQSLYAHLNGLELADCTGGRTNLDIQVLIGGDQYWKFVTGKVFRGFGGPVAMETVFGWVLSGPVEGLQETSATNLVSSTHVLKVSCESEVERIDFDKEMVNRVHQFWDTENLGVTSSDDRVMKEFNDSILFDGRNYHVPILFNCDPHILPDNYTLCKKRLISLLHKYKSSSNGSSLLSVHNDIIIQQEADGIIESVDPYDHPEPGCVHYMPHRLVVDENRQTTKYRIVHDASAKLRNQPSINDCLEKGKNFLPEMFSLLIRFRCHKYALTSDISKAFLNIRIQEEFRNYFRFLWIDDLHKENPQIVVKRFTSVLFGLKQSPYLLNATLKFHMEHYLDEHPDLVSQFLRDLYMDDNMTGFDGIPSAFDYYRHVKALMKEGGFILRKWTSNNEELLKAITEYEKNYFGEVSPLKVDKVLGVRWDTQTDSFIFCLAEILSEALSMNIVTKEQVLSTLGRIYDPMGVLAIIVFTIKILFQELCAMKVAWKEPLGADFNVRWRETLQTLVKIKPLIVVRHFLRGEDIKNAKRLELHGFSDASLKGCAAVVYLRVVMEEYIFCNFVAAKTKIAPISLPKASKTIPRLELAGCVLLSVLMKSIIEAVSSIMSLAEIFAWSDSTDCVHWVNNENKTRKKNVQKQIDKIRGNIPGIKWLHCPGEPNPADMPSRGYSKDSDFDVWLKAPKFLYKQQQLWPKQNHVFTETLDDEKVAVKMAVVPQVVPQVPEVNLSNLFEVERFSTMRKLLRVTSYVRRFVNNFKAKFKSKNSQNNCEFLEGELQLSELETARSLWIKSEQRDILQNHKRFKELKCALGLYLHDDGILRLKGRLENITGELSQKFPIFLDCKRYFSELLILESHKKVKHNRVKDTLNEVRSAYWITQGRRTVTRVIARCALCRVFDAMAFQTLPFAPLPAFRVQADFPFSNTGVDYLGPLFVKNIFPTNADPPLTDMYKVHIVLYTCASSRAVHLDVVPDPSCSAFVRSAKRFSSRYGVPKMYISDNATCFTGPELTEYLQVMGSKWQFILEVSPWWGGFWERLVQSTKKSLRKCLGRAKLSYEELLTLLAEIECVLNSRPLCHIPEDSTDEVITPSHLLLGRRLLGPRIDVNLPDEDITATQVGKRLAYLNRLLEHFWSRWSQEYLTELRQHQHCHNRVPNLHSNLQPLSLL